MEPDHILANVRHLHSDVVRDTLKAVDRLNEVAKTVVESAKQVEKSQSNVHRQRESMLIGRINELTENIKTLTSQPDSGAESTKRQVETVLTPLMGELARHAAALSNSSSGAWQFMKMTEENQAKMVGNMRWFAIGGMIFGILLFSAGAVVGYLWR